jgi:hypothetical protein
MITDSTMAAISNDELFFNQSFVSTPNDINFSISYHLFLKNFSDNLDAFKKNQIKVAKISKFKNYLKEFDETFGLIFIDRTQIVKELYVLHQTAKSIERYYKDNLNISYQHFRAKLYFPNIIYLLVRLLPAARKFLQNMIRKVYGEFNSRSRGLINVHINSFNIDQDVIKTDILYEFLGNGLKKFDPLTINNILAFYKSCFRSVFYFYLRKKKDLSNQEIVAFQYYNDTLEDNYNKTNSNRMSIYRDVLYEIYTEKIYRKVPLLSQLGYNFQIFKNVIITNEFQSIYQNMKQENSFIDNNEFKLVDFFDDDIFLKNPEVIIQLRKLPLIYKLLKCVHIYSPNTIPYNHYLIKSEVVRDLIIEELLAIFKGIYLSDYIKDVISQIADNFIKNILSGEYINLITFTTIKIKHLSFLEQLRKFIRLCLETKF